MTREERSIKLIKEFEPKKGYLVGNSGGKDSIVLDHLMKMSGVKYHSYFSFTTVDPPEVRRFLRKHYPQTKWYYPKETMFQGIARRSLPTRLRRWCCEHLKHYVGKWNVVATGIRADESSNRANNRSEIEFFDDDKKLIFNPIYKWSERQVWEYIRKNKLPYCELYDRGYKRIGCIGCPMTGYIQKIKEFQDYPHHKTAYLWAIKKIMERGLYSDFDSPEEVFEYWIMEMPKSEFFALKDQLRLDI